MTFKGNADSVWQYLSDLGHLQFLVPSTIKSSITNGQGVQSIVTLTLHNGGKIVEKVVKFNAKKRIICYTMIETPLPIKDCLACFKVSNTLNKEVKVTFKASFFVQDGLREERIEAFEKLQKELLTNLKNFKHDK
ncbi:SRPBCC family protein [Algoriphagus sp. H41]|uniref:SRPBCC family protein n=1 Tax=Algoriphagus oliviformis TaxID=2811231 RepID=A0ABS3CAY5_9BACT|nr:SRPBCC family protein [Algoriphagus oliviformis]